MSAKPKATTAKPAGEFPDPPEGWVPSAFRDPTGPWVKGLAEVRADGADDSGPRKALSALIPVAWEQRLAGGSVHNVRRYLEAARFHRQQVQGRIGGLERQGRDTTEARGELEAADKNIARLAAEVETLSCWPGPDNLVLRQRFEAAQQHHKDMDTRIEPYKRARLPYASEWDRELYEAEKALTAAAAAWDAGRSRIDKLSAEMRKATEKAYDALAGAVAHVEDRLGESCAKIVHEGDGAFWLEFPHRAPDELLAIHARAERVNGIMEALGTDVRVGMARFLRACGEVAREVVAGKVDLGRSIPRERPPLADHNRIMDLTL